MAKLFKSSLPKVISKANKDISTIIENDIAKESEILKNLVDQVLAANLEVKKKNNQRITDTKRKLQELDLEIDDLNKSIDLVDRETVLEQLNEMIDAENKIFKARQEIRFFENENTPQRLTNLTKIYKQLAESIDDTNQVEEIYKKVLHDGNNMLFDKQLEVTNEIIRLMDELYTEKKDYVQEALIGLNQLKQEIFSTEKEFNAYIKANIDEAKLLQDKSTSLFTAEDDEIFIGEKITKDHEKKIESFNNKIEAIKAKNELKKQEIIDNYNNYKDGVRAKLEAKNAEALAKEQAQIEQKNEELKNIRLLIIDAEKKQNYGKVQSLMKKFEKVEKSKISKVSDKTGRLLLQETRKSKEKAIVQLESLNIKLVTDLNKQEFNLKLEDVKFQEAKILYKIKADFDALTGDIDINKQKMQNIVSFLNEKERITKLVYDLKLKFRLAELEMMKRNELSDNNLVEEFRNLLQNLKLIEHKRILALQDNIGNHELIRLQQQYNINKTVLDLQLDKELTDIDKLILKKRNDSLIRIEKIKEDANSEIIYQESLVKIAKKEHELQLVKVKSLYENERSLAEEQVERINLGVQVNDAFVKTTLENQLLFATQQIKCAVSEYEIRVESVALTKEQELAYANKKIDYYRQKYEYEKSKIKKELDDKLEDLNFKLLLFTEKKENEQIQSQIDELTARYQAMIDEIEVLENQDEEIKRYEKVIEAAEARAESAINEAEALKEQTTTAFTALYNQTKQKYDQIQQTNHSEDTVGIMPLLNSSAVSSADERLQKAIKEADELYNERILKPTNIIKETTENLLELTKDEETERFCNEQKEIKKEKIQAHSIELHRLQDEKEANISKINEDIEISKKQQEQNLQNERTSLFDAPLYRTEDIINKDYSDLVIKETQTAKQKIAEVKQFKNERILEHKLIAKETNKWIKQTIRPYKKYIRFASRGVNAAKRELIRKNKRILKKAINEAKDQFQAPVE